MKWFTVATEGQTTDGREIQPSWLEEIAATYDRKKYGARIWLEHIRSLLPDSPFKAYGDVLAVRTAKNAEGKTTLEAQLDPTPELVAMNKTRQKIFTSMEIQPNFAGSGKYGLIGLAVTDSPASLGTDILAFAAQNPTAHPYAARKQSPENLFTSAMETVLDFSEPTTSPASDAADSFFSRLGDLLRGVGTSNRAPQERQTPQASDELLQAFTAFEKAYREGSDATAAKVAKLESELAEFKKTAASAEDLAQLRAVLDKTPNGYASRPAATGGNGEQVTDC